MSRSNAGPVVNRMSTAGIAPHDELPCALFPHEDGRCDNPAAVSIIDQTGDGDWGCEQHAAQALAGITGARISKVADWSAARQLLALLWNSQRGDARMLGIRHRDALVGRDDCSSNESPDTGLRRHGIRSEMAD